MKEEIKRLEILKQKIRSTWALLDIDALMAEEQALEYQMQQPDFWLRADEARETSKRHDLVRGEVETWVKLEMEVAELLSLAQEAALAPDEGLGRDIRQRLAELEAQFQKLEFWLLFAGKHDKANAIVSVHAGSGGTEAQDWAEMLRRMLFRYAEKKDWDVTLIDESRGQEAGIKSCVFRVAGRYAYGHLKSEHGTHRLVRISPFDAEKMRHTSFALVEVIPEIETADVVQLDLKDLRIDTFMSGGHGGQSVNTTYSAVRIVHIPTGITVQCQNERSQMQNKAVAWRVLQSKLQALQEEREQKLKQEIRGEYKSAEWGNQIRSYVLQPYKLVKDVRTKFETADPEAVLDGELDPFVEAYLRWRKQKS